MLPEAFGRPERPTALQYTGPAVDGAAGASGVVTTSSGGGQQPLDGVSRGREQNRNELCACGSGKKFKRCHGDPRHS